MIHQPTVLNSRCPHSIESNFGNVFPRLSLFFVLVLLTSPSQSRVHLNIGIGFDVCVPIFSNSVSVFVSPRLAFNTSSTGYSRRNFRSFGFNPRSSIRRSMISFVSISFILFMSISLKKGAGSSDLPYYLRPRKKSSTKREDPPLLARRGNALSALPFYLFVLSLRF